jgi:hypothetical protein
MADQFCNVVVLAKEIPSNTCTDSVHWFKTRTFIADDLLVFAITPLKRKHVSSMVHLV